MIFKKRTLIKTVFLFLAASTCTISAPVQIDAVARFANTSGTSLTDSPVKINNAGSVTGIYNLAIGNDITSVNNIHMSGGNLTGVNDLQMSGDIYGANDLNFTGDLIADGDLYMQGSLFGVTNIHMNGGNITGVNDIDATGNINMAGGDIISATNITLEGGDLSGITNLSMTEGGDITGAVNIEMTGDITGGNDIQINNNLDVGNSAHILGNLVVDGFITGSLADGDVVFGSGSSTLNAFARYDNTTGNLIKDSPVTSDDAGSISGVNNLSLSGITPDDGNIEMTGNLTVGKNVTIGDDLMVSGTIFVNEIANLNTGVGVLWPTNAGSVGQFLGIIAPGQLSYDTPTGAGNVTAANAFTTDDKIVLTAFTDGARNIKESNITLDTSNNISGVATLGATTVSAQTINAITGAATINTKTLNVTNPGIINATTVNATTVVAPNLTGLASLNLPLTGGTLSGNLNLATQSALNFQDLAGGEFVGLRAPATVGTSYTLELPGTAPLAGQYLQALAPLGFIYSTTWANIGGSPAASKTFYVAKNGSDSNDGSFSAPFKTIKHAVSIVNALLPAPNPFTNPIIITVGAGIFGEDRIDITVDGLSIVGSSQASTIITPNNPTAEDLFYVTKPYFNLSNLTLQGPFAPPLSTFSALNIATTTFGRGTFNSLAIAAFNKGITINTSGTLPVFFFENIQSTANGTSIVITNAQAIINNSTFRGPLGGTTPVNTGITSTGGTSSLYVNNSLFLYFTTALSINSGVARLLSTTFESTGTSIICQGGSKSQLIGLNFLYNSANSVNVSVDGAKAYIDGCMFDCESTADAHAGTALRVVNGGSIIANACTIEEALVGITCGSPDYPGDLSTINATGFSIIKTDTNLQQYENATLYFVGGTFDADKLNIQDPTKITISAFNTANESTLALGNNSNASKDIYEILNGNIAKPHLTYEPSYYGHSGTVYEDHSGAKIFNAIKSYGNDARYGILTTDNSKETSLRLISDTSGGSSGANVRGWALRKTGTDADLAFTYTDNDQTLPQFKRGPYDVMRLNGRDNRVEFPVATGSSLPANLTAQLLWGNDTNLYRSSANTLQTDGNFIIGTNPTTKLQVNSLSPNRTVVSNATSQLESSVTTTIELGYLSGVTSSVQTQLTGKVDRAGDTMTGALQLPAGSTALPSLNFTGGVTAGLSSNSGSLSLSTAATERLNIAAAGALTAYAPLNLATQNPLQFQDAAGGEFVALRAPATVGTSYTVALPATKPFAGQFLQAMSDSTLTWTTIGGLPHDSLAFYVAFNGNDSNDGSFAYPFATVKHAVEVANIEALRANPVIINIGPGEFYEDNSTGPFLISNNRISLVGASLGSTLLYAESASQDFFRVTTPDAEFSDLTLMGPSNSTASAISYESNSFGYNRFSSIAIAFFGTGLKLRSGTPSVTLVLVDNLQCTGNGTCIDVDGVQIAVRNSLLQGSLNTPVYTGIKVSGSGTLVALLSSYLSFFNTAITTSGGSTRVTGCNIESSTNGVICTGGSTKVVGSNFLLSNASTIHLSASGANTQLTAVGCQLQCTDAGGTARGTGVKVTTQATAILDSCDIQQAVVGIQCGQAGDLSDTVIKASGVSLVNCTTDIQQLGSAKLNFVGGTYDATKLSINDNSTVSIAAFNSNGSSYLSMGNASDTPFTLYRVENGVATPPILAYENNYYGGFKGTVYKNQSSNPTFNATQAQSNHARYYVITNDKTKEAGIHLVSDADPVGDADNVRGWSMTKTGTSAELAFAYANTDDGQLDRGPYNVMQLDGFNNIMQFPIATDLTVANTTMHLEWAGDTALYRAGDATLKIDNNLIINGLNTTGIVHTTAGVQASPLSSSLIVNDDIHASAGIVDSKLAQITTSGKVANSATTATNSNTPNMIVARDVSGNFSANIISAVTRFSGALTGNVTGSLFGNADTATSATNFSGSLSGNVTGLQNNTVVASVGGKSFTDIANSVDATQGASSSATTGAALVKRDGSGGFGAGIITATSFSGPLSGNAATATLAQHALRSDYAWSFTGQLAGDVTGPQNSTAVILVGGQSAAAVAAATTLANTATWFNTFDTLVRRNILDGSFSAGPITANLIGNASSATNATYFTTPLSGDLIGGDFGSTGTVQFVGGKTKTEIAASVNATQAATNTNTFDTIVKRDPSGNFSANNITAVTRFFGSLTGAVTGNADTATTAGSASTFSTALSGNVTGGANGGTTTVVSVGGKLAADIATSVNATVGASASDTTGAALVKRNGSGGFGAGTITATQFSGPLSGAVTGDVTGNLFGTADYATYATTSTNFTGLLAGDVTGLQSATSVFQVGGVAAASIAAGANLANAATHLDADNTLVKRDASGNFATNMITLNGLVNNPNDATTKQYVDDAVTGGLVPKTPVLVTSISDTALTGTGTGHALIDSVTLSNNDRVLLTAQNYTIDNGIWLAQEASWIRPTDFANGSEAQGAYVLTDSGTNRVGTGWLCSTPLAIIGTDTVTFVQFSSAGQTTAANVGTGDGQIFRDKTGIVINLKTLAAATVNPAATGNFVTITNGINELTLAVTATSDSTNNTLVARDGSGNFSANTITAALTGAASLNVRNDIDNSMFANLTMATTAGPTRHQINWQDSTGSNYVGLKAPASVGTSYTVALPSTLPVAGQVLQVLSGGADATLTWTVSNLPPAATRTIYVSLSGNDANAGSFSEPLRHVAVAVTLANSLATVTTPVNISIGAGIFTEDNSGGPLTLSANNICVLGSSVNNTTIIPTTTTINHDLFRITATNGGFANLSLQGNDSASTALNYQNESTGHVLFNNLNISSFATGISASSLSGMPILQINNCSYTNNGIGVDVADVRVLMQNSLFRGTFTDIPGNIGVQTSGLLGQSAISNSLFTFFDTAIKITNSATQRVLSTDIESTNNGIMCDGGSDSQLVGLNFLLNTLTSINVAASGSGTKVTAEGCNFYCSNNPLNPRGTAFKVTTGAEIVAGSHIIRNAALGLECGTTGDTIATILKAGGIFIIGCTADIQQTGLSMLRFLDGVFDATKINIDDPANVNIVSNERTGEYGNISMSIGNTKDVPQGVYEILQGTSNFPSLNYESNYYGHKGTIYKNPNADPTCSGVQAQSNDACYYAVTGDRDKKACINLISDTSDFGNGNNVQGWTMSKLGNATADLVFTYTNNDSGAYGPNNIMELDGVNNQIKFPTATNAPFTTPQLVWGGDTNLYRSAANTLKTDDDVIIGTTPGNNRTLTVSSLATTTGLVHSDATGLLTSSLLVNADIAANAQIADTKLAIISTAGKVANSATTATALNNPNTIVLRDASNNFAANMITASITGTASGNVLKIGDTMTGNLVLAYPSEVRFAQDTGASYVGLKAPSTVGSSYSVALPGTAPVAGQTLLALSDTILTWTKVAGAPATTRTIYVSKNGSDTNDGSIATPYLTVKHAVDMANGLASLTTPVTINIGAGVFVENIATGSINITVEGISIVGSSIASTILISNSLDNDFFTVNTGNVMFSNLTLRTYTTGSTRTAIAIAAETFSRARFSSVGISLFGTGISMSSQSGLPFAFIENVQCTDNVTCLSLNNVQAAIRTCLFQGSSAEIPANTALMITGTTTQAAVLSSYFTFFDTAITTDNKAHSRILGSTFENSINGITCIGGSHTQLIGLNFLWNYPTSINVAASGSDTKIYTEACLFTGVDYNHVPQGTCIQATNQAYISVNASTIQAAAVGLKCADSGTELHANGVTLANTATCIQQRGTSILHFVGGSFNTEQLDIENTTNVSFAAFDTLENEAHLSIGNAQDSLPSRIYEIFNGQTVQPYLSYEPNYYGYKGTTYINPDGSPTFNGTQSNSSDARYYVTTGLNEKEAGISLISDSNIPGALGNVRGWSITKTGTEAHLAFTFENNDPSVAIRDAYNVARFDGLNNRVEFPTATGSNLPPSLTAQLVWAGDTNLYRDSANILKTDDNVVIGGLAPTAGVVHNSSTGLLSSSLVTNNDIIAAAGIVDTKLATISTPLKVSNSATTATNLNTNSAIVARDSSGDFLARNITATQFNGALNGNANTATSATTAGSATNFTAALSGDVTGTQGFTKVEYVGLQSAANVAAATLLANQATSANTPDYIVRRAPTTGNFSAGTITATLSGNATSATSAITSTTSTYFTGSLAGDVIGTQAATIIALIGGQTATSVASTVTTVNAATHLNTANQIVRRDVNGDFAARNITATNFTGLASNATSAVTSTTFLGSFLGEVIGTQNATVVASVGGQTATNVAAGAVLANAATDLNTPSSIVKRTAGGNFTAGTITANLTGLASNATTAVNFSGSVGGVGGDVTGNQGTMTVNTVGGSAASAINSATILANAATNLNTLNAIVKRDGSGNFIAGTITASLTGLASLNLPLTGGTLTGALTLPAGTAAAPSLQFTGGGVNAGVYSPGTNSISLSTASTERMNINATGVVSIPGSLTLAPGSVGAPSFNFSNGTTTGISSATANTLSFDVSGVEKMSMDATSVTVTAATFVVGTLMAVQSRQVEPISGTVAVSINSNTSILFLTYSANATANLTFPLDPIDGQMLTIIAVNTTTTARTLTLGYTGANPLPYGATGATNSHRLTSLSPGAALLALTGGASITYIFSATDNVWYRYWRG